ncbi:MAG: GAP family protein [Pyrinomonadaceae bacterium]
MNPISDLLPSALGIVASPMPLIAMLVLCIIGVARTSGTFFLLGWFLGAFASIALAVVFNTGDSGSTQNAPSTAQIVMKFVVAFLLLYLAFNNWRTRPKPDDKISAPGWVDKLSKASVLPVFGIGMFLCVLNVKNLPLLLSAALTVSDASKSVVQGLIYDLIFSLMASFGLALPWVITIFGGKNVKKSLESTRDWLFRYNNVIMAVLFLYLGLNSLAGAISNIA